MKSKIKNSDSLLVNFNYNIQKYNTEKLKFTTLKLIIPNYGIIPDGKQGAGHKAWTFIDEIIVE